MNDKKKPPSEKRKSTQINVRWTFDELAEFEAIAETEGRAVSEVVRIFARFGLAHYRAFRSFEPLRALLQKTNTTPPFRLPR
jgi:hypothetical protein